MFTTACPSCGATVSFRSPAAVMAVCEYCQSTLLREADAVKDIGKMSAVLEDYSPIQITTSGSFGGRNFGVVGRIQLRYEAGFWNEWYLLFDDGAGGWLSDASGQYVLTLDQGKAGNAPDFGSLQPGAIYAHDGKTFHASDVRTARCTGGEGELPFVVGQGWQAKVADFRAGQSFLTLDYSDGLAPALYLGRAVTLEELKCQLLRSEQQIIEKAGRLQGAVASLECPSCGSSIAYSAGVTSYLACPSCHASSAIDGGKAVVLDKARQLEAEEGTLELGEVASIDGSRYVLIGYLRCREVGESDTWLEYLLYHHGKGFLWLVETDEGWERVDVLNAWPEQRSASSVLVDGAAYNKLYDYASEVLYAAGAFNWQVRAGDRVQITDYKRGQAKVSAERSANEIVWSRSQPVSAEQIAKWFGHPVQAPAAPKLAKGGTLRKIAKVYTWMLLLFNGPVALFGGFGNWLLVGIALLALWIPVWSENAEKD